MGDWRDLFGDSTQVPLALHGKIAKTATGFTARVPVLIPSFDATLEWGPCRWQARDATSLPQKGDACLVIFSEKREPWVVAWWPF